MNSGVNTLIIGSGIQWVVEFSLWAEVALHSERTNDLLVLECPGAENMSISPITTGMLK